MGPVTSELQQRRGVVEDMQQNGEEITVIANAPVSVWPDLHLKERKY